MRQTKLATIAVYLLVLFGLGCFCKAETTTEIVVLDFETGSTTIQELTFDDNEGTVITLEENGDISIQVLEVQDVRN